ncbi:MAG: hypothetical protein L3J79_07440, partial [Candidatus Marinimicrobia bacterium]|nr:hypothetical protein [Candidatus Neomarinimicrobiota bacterium]
EVDETFPIANDFTDITTVGGNVKEGYWNISNTGIDITVPMTDDVTLTGGTLQIAGDLVFGDGFFETFAVSQPIVSPTGPVSISIPDTEVEGLEGGTGFVDGLTIEFIAIVTDAAGNESVSNISTVTLEIDQVIPDAPDISDIIVKGTNEVDGVWNTGADSLLIALPFDTETDTTLAGGSIGIYMSIGNAPDENAYENVTGWDITGIEDTIRLGSTSITNLANFADSKTLYTRIVIEDRAGNDSTGATSIHEVLIDVGPPAAFECGPLTAIGGTSIAAAYNNTNTGITLEIPIADDSSLLSGSAIIKVALTDLDLLDFVAPSDVDTVTIDAINTTLVMTLDHATLSALAGFGSNFRMDVTAGLLDYAGNQELGSEVLQSLTIDLDGPQLPIINDTTTVGGNIVSGYWNASNSGIQFIVSTPVVADTSLLEGYFQVQGRIGLESFVDLGDSIDIVSANFTELSTIIDSSDIKALAGFSENLEIDLRVQMVDGRGNDTTGAIIDNWLLTDQIAPTLGAFLAEATTSDPFINAEDTLKAQWSGFNDATTGIAGYEYSIGHAIGDSDFLDWLSLDISLQDTLMVYSHGADYYQNVRAVDVAGNLSEILTNSRITADLEIPLSSIDVQPYYLIDDWVDINSFGGLYSDGLAGVDTLWMDLSRASDSLYWDGTDWVSDSTSLELPIVHDGLWSYSIASDTLSNHENYLIRLMAVDSAGNRQTEATLDSFQFIINSAPEIFTFASDTTTLEDSLFSYSYFATDPDFETSRGDSLFFTLGASAPAGMTIDSTGFMTWLPVDSAVGEHTYATYVTDLLGLQDSVISTLTVLNVNDAPEAVTLLLPTDSTQLMPADSLLLTFSWTTAFDIESNPLRYEITMLGSDYDTTIATTDTALTVDVSVMDYPVSIVEWFVVAFDLEDTSAVADTFHVTTSAALAELNTDSIAVDVRRFSEVDTLISLNNLGLTDLRWSLVDAPAWISFTTESGTVVFADSTEIALKIDPVGFTVGGYAGTFRLATNDPLQDTRTVGVSMTSYDTPTPVLACYKNPAYPAV